MAKLKGRKRNLKTIRQVAESKVESKKKPFWLKRLFSPIIWVFKTVFGWLNQPVNLHSYQEQSKLVGAFTKQRSMAPNYLQESWQEMKLVVWPRFSKAMRLTLAVFIFATIFTLIITSLDRVLTEIFKEIILNKAENLKNLF